MIIEKEYGQDGILWKNIRGIDPERIIQKPGYYPENSG